MRVIIVEGTLDEVLTVMQRVTREGLVTPPPTAEPAEPAEPPAGDGEGGDGDPTKHEKQCMVALPLSCAVERLTDRQQVILAQIIEGASNKQIARKLGIEVATVKAHVRSLLKKLGVVNRTQAATWGQMNFAQEARLPAPVATPAPTPILPVVAVELTAATG